MDMPLSPLQSSQTEDCLQIGRRLVEDTSNIMEIDHVGYAKPMQNMVEVVMTAASSKFKHDPLSTRNTGKIPNAISKVEEMVYPKQVVKLKKSNNAPNTKGTVTNGASTEIISPLNEGIIDLTCNETMVLPEKITNNTDNKHLYTLDEWIIDSEAARINNKRKLTEDDQLDREKQAQILLNEDYYLMVIIETSWVWVLQNAHQPLEHRY